MNDGADAPSFKSEQVQKNCTCSESHRRNRLRGFRLGLPRITRQKEVSAMRTINIGEQWFEDIRAHDDFYVDKTSFIKEWWENRADVTLITRPRRFGKTLNMSMLECFFSQRYAGRSDLFEGLSIWEEEKYRAMQGTYPVIFLSFASIKEKNVHNAVKALCYQLARTCGQYSFLLDSGKLQTYEKERLLGFCASVSEVDAANVLNFLSEMLCRHFGKKVLIFLDEYDTPLQEAFVGGYWEEMSDFIRSLFNSTFKTNPYMERAVMTGITRVSKESIFSDLNNLDVVTTTSEKYETAFGFTEEEVFTALGEYDLSDQKENVRAWYDGFTFGKYTDIYNPWSIINFLRNRKFAAYWANTSSNKLIGELIWNGDGGLQNSMETLLYGGTVRSEIDEEVVFSDLKHGTKAVWSLMAASGYLKILSVGPGEDEFAPPVYTLCLTNGEVRRMFGVMIRRWFDAAGESNSGFVRSMLSGDVRSMNQYMNDIAESVMSFHDTGEKPSKKEPERFYHGFVLGLLVGEAANYEIKSNRESGYGRYDICMYPRKKDLPGIVIEFKVFDAFDDEKSLGDTADSALRQIRDKDYAADLRSAGVADILQYGFAFRGKEVLIKKAEQENRQ